MTFFSSKYVDGGARHLFEEKGIIDAENKGKDLEMATEDAIVAGAEDVKLCNDQLQFVSSPSTFVSVQKNLIQMNYSIKSASVEFIPVKMQPISEADMDLCSSLYEKLENLQEVVKLHDNIE